jgi:Ras-related GTP-binding protein A/B
MDLIAEDQRDSVFAHKEQEIKSSSAAAYVSCYKTSIWDETLCVCPFQQLSVF